MIGWGPHRTCLRAADVGSATGSGSLPVDIYEPAVRPVAPVIVFSHGAGALRGQYELVAAYWASYGFVCIVPLHLDSLDRLLPDLGLSLERPREVLSDRRVAARLRAAADTAALVARGEELCAVLRAVPELARDVHPEAVGLAGHSVGASCAQVAALARALPVVALSGPGPGLWGLTPESWQRLDGPLLVVTGDDDPGPDGQPTSWRHAAFHLSPPGDKYLLTIPGVGHGLGGLAAGGPRDLHALSLVLGVTRQFWEAHLLGRPLARKLLRTRVTDWR